MVSEEAAEAAAGSTITPRELRDLLDSGRKVALIDVREPVEWDINRIEGAELIPKSTLETGDGLAGLPQDRCRALLQDRRAFRGGVGRGEEGRLHRCAAPAGRHRRLGKQCEPDMVMY